MTDPVSIVGSIASSPGTQMTRAAVFTETASGPSFADTLRTAASNTVTAVASSEKLAALAVQGQANLQDVVQATISAELAVETAITIRNKAIESTQEILRMPV